MKKYISAVIIAAVVLIIISTVAVSAYIRYNEDISDTSNDTSRRPRPSSEATESEAETESTAETEDVPLPSTPNLTFAVSHDEITLEAGKKAYIGIAAYPEELFDISLYGISASAPETADVADMTDSTFTVMGLTEGTSVISILYGGKAVGEVTVHVTGFYVPPETETETTPETEPDPPFKQSDRIDPSRPMIALTFDDGPSKTTLKLLDVFREYNCRGTFFVVGNRIKNYKNSLIRMSNEGHELGIHTWSHEKLTVLSLEAVRSEVSRVRDELYALTNKLPHLVRPPYGSVNETVKEASRLDDFYIVNWNIDTLDWQLRNVDKIYDSIMSQARDGSIILLHDLHAETVDAVIRAIPDLIAKGYQLVTVSELLSYSEKAPSTGTVIRHQ